MDKSFKDFGYKDEQEMEERYYSMCGYANAVSDPVERKQN